MFPVGEVGSVVWKEIRLENKAARYLVCPGYDLCEDLNDRTAIFDAPVSRLFDEWSRIISEDEEGMELVLSEENIRQYSYVIRSSFLQMPDIITVQFFEYLEDENRIRSSIAIYSRRVYVSGDFGANAARVARYLDELERVLGVYRR
jgi:mevalonate pyrophosphate decarboxylase